MTRADLPMLARWLAQPHVGEWWRDEPADRAAVEAKYGPCIDGDDPTELFVIEELSPAGQAPGRPVGMIQRYLFADEPDWVAVFDGIVDVDVDGAAGIDYLIGEPDAVGRGLGAAAIAAFTELVFDWRPVPSIVVTVQQDNRASWRVLERAGFQRVWAGELDSPDPSDQGPEYVYRRGRPNRLGE
jgi:aminoglycoside 6'-N-acetyltransferase